MNTASPSNAMALACKAARDRPERSDQPGRKASVSGRSSYTSMPLSSSRLRVLAYPACAGSTSFEASELVSTRTRTSRSCSALTVACAPAGRTKYGVSTSSSCFRCAIRSRMKAMTSLLSLPGGDAFRIVGDNIAVCPHEIVAKLGALGSELAEVLVDRIGVVGRRDRLTQANPDGIEIGSVMGTFYDGCDRNGGRDIPVSVEHARQSRTTGPTANTSRSR